MNLARYKPQNLPILKRNQPDLYDTIKHVVPSLNDEQFSKVSGLIIEYVIQSGGDVDIFSSDSLEEDDEL